MVLGILSVCILGKEEEEEEEEKASLNSFILNTAVAQHTGKHFIIC